MGALRRWWNLLRWGHPWPESECVLSHDPIPPQDIERARQLAKERGWKDISA